MASRTPLIGRVGILTRVTELIGRDGSGVVLVGEAGVGKSRIASEVLRLGAERGFATASTIGTQAAADIPLGALSHLLPDLGTASGNVLAAARTVLLERAAGRRLMLSVDDAHLLDRHSATLVLQLAMAMPSFVVATIRAGEPVPDAVVALWKEGLAERIEVDRLDDASIADIVSVVLSGPAERDLVVAVVGRAAGNPLVARELCLSALDSGAVASRNGRWGLIGTLQPSARLIELVASRIEGLEGAERRALDLLALAEPLPMAVAHAMGAGPSLIELERRGLVVLREDGRRRELWLSHPYYADVLRARAGSLLTASLKGELADATRAFGMRRRSDLIRVATWLMEAARADSDLLLEAAHETYRARDLAGTARLAAGAWDNSPTAEAGHLLATSLGYLGRHEEADAILAAAARLASDDDHRARIAIAHSTILSVGLRLYEEAITVLDQVEPEIREARAARMIQAQRAHLLALRGDVDAVLELARPILAEDDGIAAITAGIALLICYTSSGSYAASADVIAKIGPSHRALWNAGIATLAPEILELVALQARVLMGELDAVEMPAASRRGRVAAGPGGRPVAVLRAVDAAIAALLRGRPREAAQLAAEPDPDRTDRLIVTTEAINAFAAALTGNADDAAAKYAAAERVARETGTVYNRVLDEARVWTLVAQHRPHDARAEAIAVLNAAIAAHRWGVALAVAHDLARLGGVGEAVAALARIDGPVDGPLALARRLHIQALASGDAEGLDAASLAFADLGADLYAAEAAADAGRAARRAGDPRRATRFFQRAVGLAAQCEGATTPALLMPDELTPLSAREREVAALAASGLSSDAIASRLFLSVRTVDNHLAHVYQKLGIAGRSELERALRGSTPNGIE